MSFRLNGKLAITFLFSLALLLALASPSSANAMSPESPRRRDHPNLNRMIKMRAAAPPVARQGKNAGAVGAAANPPGDSSTPSTPSSTPASPSTSNTPQSSSATPSSQPITSLLSLVPSPASTSSTSSSSASSTSSTASVQTTTSSTSSSSAPTSSATSSTQRNAQSATSNTPSASVDSVTVTSHVPAASSSSSADNSQIGGSSLSHTTIMILIILAASIGGCAIIWTIIRKWKFRPSSQFEDRLEPVNWQPAEHESGLPTHHRMPSNASSFHSAGHDNLMGLSRSNSGGTYNAPRGLSPLPEHDFTAGPAPLAAGGGYADLARGPSPQPQMHEALQRGPSFRGYDDYVAPAHYQGGQEAYDHGNAGPRY